MLIRTPDARPDSATSPSASVRKVGNNGPPDGKWQQQQQQQQQQDVRRPPPSPISQSRDANAHRIPQAAESELSVAERHDGRPSRSHSLTTGAPTSTDIEVAVARASADALTKLVVEHTQTTKPSDNDTLAVSDAAPLSSTVKLVVAGDGGGDEAISVVKPSAITTGSPRRIPDPNTLATTPDTSATREAKIKVFFPSDDENTSELSEVPSSELESSESESDHSSLDDGSDSDSADGDSSDDGNGNGTRDFPSSRRTSLSGEEIEDFTAPLLDPNDMRSDDAEYTEHESKFKRNARGQSRRNTRSSTRSSARTTGAAAARNSRKRSSPLEVISSSESDQSDVPIARARSLTLRRGSKGSKKTPSGARQRAVFSSSSEGGEPTIAEICTNPNRLAAGERKSLNVSASRETSVRRPKQPRGRPSTKAETKSLNTARSRSTSADHSHKRRPAAAAAGDASGGGGGGGGAEHGTDTSTTKTAVCRSTNGAGQAEEDGFFLGARFHRWERIGDRDKSGRSILRRCVESHNLELLRKLLNKRADPNVQCHAGFTPLHSAALSGTAEEAALLLRHGAIVDIPGMNGDTPIFDAVTEGNDAVVELLLLHGANIAVVNENGQTPLTAGDERMATLITNWLDQADAVATVDAKGDTPLHVACVDGKVEDFARCLKYGADVNMRGHDQQTPLHLAVLHGRHSFVVELLDCGAEVDAENAVKHSPLGLAVQAGQRDIIQLLLEYGADAARIKFDTSVQPSRDIIDLLKQPRSHWAPHKQPTNKLCPVDRAAQRVSPACSTQGSSSELPDAPTATVAKRRDSSHHGRHAKYAWHSKNELFANGGIMPEEVSLRELRKIERYNQVHKESPVVLPSSLGKPRRSPAAAAAAAAATSSLNPATRPTHRKKSTSSRLVVVSSETASPDDVKSAKMEDDAAPPKPKPKLGRPPKDPSKRAAVAVAEEQQSRSKPGSLAGNPHLNNEFKPVNKLAGDAAAATEVPVKKRYHKKRSADESQPRDGVVKTAEGLGTPRRRQQEDDDDEDIGDLLAPIPRGHKKRVPTSSPPGERRENKVQKLNPDTPASKTVGRPPPSTASKTGKSRNPSSSSSSSSTSSRPVASITSAPSRRAASPLHDSDFDEDLAIMHSASMRKRSLTKAQAELDSPTKLRVSPGLSIQTAATTGRKPTSLDLKRGVPESPTDRAANAQGQLRGKSPPLKKPKSAAAAAKPGAFPVSSSSVLAASASASLPEKIAQSTSPVSRKDRAPSAELCISASSPAAAGQQEQQQQQQQQQQQKTIVTPDRDPVSYSPGSPGGVWGQSSAYVPPPPPLTLPPAVVVVAANDRPVGMVATEPGHPDNAIRRATESEAERRLRVCVPLYSFALPTDTTNATPPPPAGVINATAAISTTFSTRGNPNGSSSCSHPPPPPTAERWMLDWQLGLYFGYRSSKAFLDANPSVRARVASEEEKRLMERCAPLAAQVLESQLHNDPEVRRYLRTVNLPAVGGGGGGGGGGGQQGGGGGDGVVDAAAAGRLGLRFTYYDCKFVRLEEVRGLLTRLEAGGLVDVVLQ
ncbi:hypothetical protein HDU86_002374 [Geranomyces michiganensis]|nr:hypothetical protein HDU86_002374 [Geranomyces michiganensis]